MSLNVLVIPEDFRKDQYVLKPLVDRMLKRAGVRARVNVCKDPLLGGVGEALKPERLAEIVDRYRGMVRLFLLIVDRDCKAGRRDRLDELEAQLREALEGTDRIFLAENAWQEVEVWVLAGMDDLPADWAWNAVRADCDPKETYYDPYAERRGLLTAPYEGRDSRRCRHPCTDRRVTLR
jgi:hypothetical protein